MCAEHRAQRQRISVLRLASISLEPLETMLFRRHINPESLEDVLRLLSSGDVVTSPVEVLDDAFRPRSAYETPYPQTRFSDGTIGVYYSAIEERTCKEEIAFHLRSSGPTDVSRYYSLVACTYEGETVDLRGIEKDKPELISKDESGYSYCRNLAKRAVELGHDAFLTPSARAEDGTCVPVFNRSSLSHADTSGTYCATIRDTRVTFHQL